MGFVQGVDYAYSSGSPYANTYGSNNGSGNMLIVQFNGVGTGPVSIADSNGNTSKYVLLFAGAPDAGQYTAMWYAPNCAAGANTVTVTAANCGSLGGVALGEWSGVNSLDSNSNTNFNTTSPPTFSGTTTSVTTQYANESLIAFFICSAGYASIGGSGFNFGQGITYSGLYYPCFTYQDNASAGAYTATVNVQNNTGAVYGFLAAFYQASSGAPTTNALTRMGCGI